MAHERIKGHRATAGTGRWVTFVVLAVLCTTTRAISQTDTTAAMQGRVFDTSGAVLPGASIGVRHDPTGSLISVHSDGDGRYSVHGLLPGTYTVSVELPGFRTHISTETVVHGGRPLMRDFHLAVADRRETVLVRADTPDTGGPIVTTGHVVGAPTVQEIPMNGRHFMDLGLLAPGSVAPSQNGFSSRPIRGLGTLAFNTAGNREEAVGFAVNGVSTNNLTFGSLVYEPPLASIQEYKLETSVFGPEHGHVSGAVVNVVTQSGSDALHGAAFEFARDDALNARNFFEQTSADPHPFHRHQFGGSLGGPVRRGRTFFFGTYEGVRHREGVDLNSLALSDQQRSAAADPIVRQLIQLIPRANLVDANGVSRFVGAAPASVEANRWTIDAVHALGQRDRLHAFFGRQRAVAVEPTVQGNSIPGFGTARRPLTSVLTVNDTHMFSPALLNEARFGRTVLRGGTRPASALNPLDFGIRNGVTRPIGLPQIIVAGDLNFGGPALYPQGRYDTLYVFADTFSRSRGRHTTKLGGEYRHFVNDNFAEGTGMFNFPSIEAFLAGTANAFTITLGERRSVIDQRALASFLQDSVRISDNLTLDLGVRYEWHVTPTERDDRFVVFDAASISLQQVGIGAGEIYRQNNRNFEPRIGIVWSISRDGRTVLRSAFGRSVDQPGTSMVRDTAGNPPFAVPLAAAGSIALGTAVDSTRPVGLAPVTVDPQLRNASLRSWNVDVQRRFGRSMAATIAYLGSQGANLRLSRNINQPVSGVRPFPALSASSPILPGASLGNITQAESSGFSSYNAALVSVTKRLSAGLQFDASYTLSKSLDTNSLNSSNFNVQDAYDIAGQYGLSDFDARHRFVFSGTYALPFTRDVLTRGWQVAAVVQSQSGNPVNIVTSNSSLTGVPNSVRPDVTGPVRIIGSVNRWFDPSAFVAVNRFGNLPRNAVIGPAFHNTDVSLIKTMRLGERSAVQLRADVFDVFNHSNFGSPGNIVGSPTFGVITATRLPTGEAGSSRQIQLAARVSF